MSYIYTHGSGTVEDPYQIWTAADLDGVRDHLSGCYFKQMADIDLSEWGHWQGIGDLDDSPGFEGFYDGQDFKITNLTIDTAPGQGGTRCQGLFGKLGPNSCSLKNIVLFGSNTVNDGLLVGQIYSCDELPEGRIILIDNCHVIGTLASDRLNQAGAIGHVVIQFGVKLYIVDCSFSLKFTGEEIESCGMIGEFSTNGPDEFVLIENCAVEIDVSSDDGRDIGGICGEFTTYNNSNITIKDCSVKGKIEAKRYLGGAFGTLESYANTNLLIENCHIDVEVAAGENRNIGGFVGYAYVNGCVFKKIYCNGNIYGGDSGSGGLIGSIYGEDVLIEQCCHIGNVICEDRVGGLFGYLGLDSGGVIRQCFNIGNAGPDNEDAYYGDVGGLFGVLGYGENILIEDCFSVGDVDGPENIGGLVGKIDGVESLQIKRCYCSGKVVGNENIGGFVGYVEEPDEVTIEDCYFNFGESGVTDDYAISKTTAEMTYPYSDPENVFINWAFYEENEDWVWVHDKPENKYDVTCTITDNNFIIDTCLVYGSNRAFCEYRYLAYLLHQEAYWDDYNLIFAGYDLTEHIKEYDDIVYLPVRYIAQDLLKLRVNWDETNQQVHIAGSVFGPINNGYPHFIKDVKLVYKILIPITGGTITYL